jgi:VWFA-related protein
MTAVRASLLLLACLPALAGAARDPQSRRVYVIAVDGAGAPVTDLTVADFAVKEGGKERAISRVAPATAPMQIAILVDDNGTGIFRYSVGKFMEALLGHAEFAISTVTGQTLKVVDYTQDARILSEALFRLGARPANNDGGQLLDGISETAMDLTKRGAGRPSIIALTVGGEEHSTVPAHHVLDNLGQSGAALHVIQVVNKTLRVQASQPTAESLLNENLNLSEVLGDGPKQSGGVREDVLAAASIASVLGQLAESLKQQYLIEYTLPDGVKPSDRLSVSVKRKGVTLRAPTRIPDK